MQAHGIAEPVGLSTPPQPPDANVLAQAHTPVNVVHVSGERGALGAAELVVDMDHVVKDYFDVISAKDADLFQLLDVNKRQHLSLEIAMDEQQQLHMELEARICEAQQKDEVIATTQAALDRSLADAAAAYHSLANLRSVLGMHDSSTSADVVREVSQLHGRCKLKEDEVNGCRRLHSMEHEWQRQRLREGEASMRNHVEEAAFSEFGWLAALEAESLWRRRQARELVELRAASEAESVNAAFALQHATQKAARLQRRTGEMEEQAIVHELESRERDSLLHQQLQVHELMHPWMHGFLHILMDEVFFTREQWMLCEGQRRECLQRIHELTSVKTKVTTELTTTRTILSAKEESFHQIQRKMAKMSQRCEQLEERVRVLAEMEEKHHTLQQKFATLSDDRRNAKNKHVKAVGELQSERELHREAEDEHLRRIRSLELQLQAANKSLRGREKVLHTLEEKVMEKKELDQELQLAKQRLMEAEVQVSGFNDVICELHERLDQQSSAERVQLHEQTKQLEAMLSRMEASQDEERTRQTAVMAEERQAMQEEVRDWIQLADHVRGELAVAKADAEAQRIAREGLEHQHHLDTEHIRQLLTSIKTLEQQQQHVSSQVSDLTTVASLQEKLEVTEAACRRSASVIAELREQVFMEREKRRAVELSCLDDVLLP